MKENDFFFFQVRQEYKYSKTIRYGYDSIFRVPVLHNGNLRPDETTRVGPSLLPLTYSFGKLCLHPIYQLQEILFIVCAFHNSMNFVCYPTQWIFDNLIYFLGTIGKGHHTSKVRSHQYCFLFVSTANPCPTINYNAQLGYLFVDSSTFGNNFPKQRTERLEFSPFVFVGAGQ